MLLVGKKILKTIAFALVVVTIGMLMTMVNVTSLSAENFEEMAPNSVEVQTTQSLDDL